MYTHTHIREKRKGERRGGVWGPEGGGKRETTVADNSIIVWLEYNIPCTFQFSSPWVHHTSVPESSFPAKTNFFLVTI